MAKFRTLHVSFWDDSFISELSPEYKLFYIYLITNTKTSQCGIYEITIKQMAFDLGYSIDTVSICLNYFISKDKIRYNYETFEIALKNWQKYNENLSPKVQSLINKEFKDIKDESLIGYVYGIDTVSIPQTKNEGQEEHNITEQNITNKIIEDIYPFDDFWNDYDKKVGSKSKLEKKWNKLSDKDKIKIKDFIPNYKLSQPDKKYRKNPETFLNNESWNDEIIITCCKPELEAQRITANDEIERF